MAMPSGTRRSAPAPAPTDTPEAAGAAPAGGPAADAQAALAMLSGWAEAWSNRDAEAYFAHYAPGFYFPDRDLHLAAFKRYRGGHMARAAFVKVGVEEVEVVLRDGGAVVTFVQTYESDRASDRGRKTLELTIDDGRWKIATETFTPLS
jgi:ketosteroid isomerase-like protein